MLIRYFIQQDDTEGAKKVFRLLFKALADSKEEVNRPDSVFSFVTLLIRSREFKEALMLLQSEGEFFKRENPSSTKRKTYAVDCILIGLLMDDVILSERFLEQYSKE